MGTGRGIAEDSPSDRRVVYCCEMKRVRDYVHDCCMCGLKLCEEHVEYHSGQATASSSSSGSSSSSIDTVTRTYCDLCVQDL
jgi:hypothetical protein